MFKATERCQYPAFEKKSEWAQSLLSLAFTAQWNPKQTSYCKYSVVL